MMGSPSKLSVIRKAVALARVRPTFDLNCDLTEMFENVMGECENEMR
jgi:hypothetical protein